MSGASASGGIGSEQPSFVGEQLGNIIPSGVMDVGTVSSFTGAMGAPLTFGADDPSLADRWEDQGRSDERHNVYDQAALSPSP